MFKEFQLKTIFIYDFIWVIMQTRLQYTPRWFVSRLTHTLYSRREMNHGQFERTVFQQYDWVYFVQWVQFCDQYLTKFVSSLCHPSFSLIIRIPSFFFMDSLILIGIDIFLMEFLYQQVKEIYHVVPSSTNEKLMWSWLGSFKPDTHFQTSSSELFPWQ